MRDVSAKLGLLGSIILLLASLYIALTVPEQNDINPPPLFLWLAGLITSGLGMAGSKQLSASPVLSRILLAAAAFLSLVLAAFMIFALSAGGVLTLLFFIPAGLLIVSFITSLLSQKSAPVNNDYI